MVEQDKRAKPIPIINTFSRFSSNGLDKSHIIENVSQGVENKPVKNNSREIKTTSSTRYG